MPLKLGYNTNGFAHHRLADVINILSELGYQSIAITLDHHCLDPFGQETTARARAVGDRLAHLGMTCVVETGARYLLDPWRKHWPTLISPDRDDRKRRLDFLKHSIDIAAMLQAKVVSFWSGAREGDMSDDEAMTLLVEGCRTIVDHAASQDIKVAFEPEPGMFIDTMARYAQLREHVAGNHFGLTLDVGHIHCQNDGSIPDRIHEFADVLANIHIEDMRRDVHDHLPFGQGDMDFPPIFAALKDIGYEGPVNVELGRHSNDAVNTARRSIETLRQYL